MVFSDSFPIRVAVYLRVSTEQQSHDSQLAELEDCCQRRGWNDVRWFTETTSGAKQNRDGLNDLMALVRRGKLDAVVTLKLDRLSESSHSLCQTSKRFALFLRFTLKRGVPLSTSSPIPANADGQYDVRLGLPPGCIHFLGKRLTITCRALGIECAAAIIGDAKRKKFGPLLDGVVIRAEDREKLENGVKKRDAARLTDEQKAGVRSKKQESETSAFTAEIRRQFPAMPEAEVEACAIHATEIGSGRVGRSSMTKNATGKAVVAFVRHKFTPYDSLLASGISRDDARTRILSAVQAKVNEWSPQQRVEVKPGRPSKRNKRPPIH